ncbi:MAG: DUF3320 domain-containing protein [Bacillota bacterium]
MDDRLNQNNIIERRIEEWKQRLIDLSRRNRLLYFRSGLRGSYLWVLQPDPDLVFWRLFGNEEYLGFWLPPGKEEDDSPGAPRRRFSQPAEHELVIKGLTREELQRKLKTLYRRATTDYRERGVRILYAAFGCLRWREAEATEEIVSPLVLCPVELSRESPQESFRLFLAEEDVVFNPALTFKFRKDFNLELPELPGEWEQGTLGGYLDSIARAVQGFDWAVEKVCLIGLFSFHKLVMYQDLSTNKDLVTVHPVVRALAGDGGGLPPAEEVPSENQLDRIQKPEETFQILDADSSQRLAVEAALRGNSFVLQGPPGTGKSQTIANVVAEFLARGKTVLFVSDKMAALEVVYKRLLSVGLGDFCLELHSHKANKREVVAELKRCLDEILVPKNLPSKNDFERLTRLRDRLNDYVLALHEVREPLGLSAYDVLCRLTQLHETPLVPLESADVKLVNFSQLETWQDLMRSLATVWGVVDEGRDFPWFGCRETHYTPNVRVKWELMLDKGIGHLEALEQTAAEHAKAVGVEKPVSLDGVEWLVQVVGHLMESPKPPRDWLTDAGLDELFDNSWKYRALCDAYLTTRRSLEERYSDGFFGLDLAMGDMIEAVWANLTTALGVKDDNQTNVYLNAARLRDLFEELEHATRNILRDAVDIARHLGLSVEKMTLQRAKQLQRITELAMSEHKPEASWLDPRRIYQVRALLNEIRPLYAEHNKKLSELLENYEEGILELDLDVMVERFDGVIYRSFLRWFHPRFHRDKKLIKHATRKKVFPGPNKTLEDIGRAREVKRLRHRIDHDRAETEALLGSYYQGCHTDFAAVELALDGAQEVLSLAGMSFLPDRMTALLAFGSVAPSDITDAGARLKNQADRWEGIVKSLEGLISQSIPGVDGLPPSQCPLAEVGALIESILGPLRQLCQLTDSVLAHRVGGYYPGTLGDLLADLRAFESITAIRADMEEESSRLEKIFGERYRGLDTAWEEILAALEWTQTARNLFDSSSVPDRFIRLAVGEVPPHNLSAERLQQACDKIKGFLRLLQDNFDLEAPWDAWFLADLRNKTVTLKQRLDDLEAWTHYVRVEKRFLEAGLGRFFTKLKTASLSAAQLEPALYKAFFTAWMNFVYEDDARLGEFRGRDHEQLIHEFRQLDTRLIQLSAHRVIEQCNQQRPQAALLQTQGSEVMVIRREAAKRRRHLPIRDLFARVPNLLLRLKPCLLMGPLSVSQYLNPNLIKFDLVVFDEASQIFTEDAVGAIYRGNQLVVAGDSRQLPPTNFFRIMDTDLDYDEDEEAADDIVSADFTSVLEECETVLPRFPDPFLRWHYRSKHESLIAFSNYRFYEKRLITFPSSTYSHEDLGVRLVYVPDGVYDRGGKRDNRREAEVVAELTLEHLKRYPGKSLGIVAFSQAQANTIEDLVELRRRDNPELERLFKEDRLEGFFIKNLENIQGDERDVIIFSIGYGFDQHRRITMNFGPLNKAGGERRLNVAVTRAREKVVLVSSIRASDLDMSATEAAGVLSLYHYLDYAERGEQALSLTHPKGLGESESLLEDDVASAIRQMGYDVVPQVGCSGYRIDIGVVDPAQKGRFILGVECDGATYHSAKTARDRDRLRQSVLESLGWRIYRIWSPDWVAKRVTEVERLRKAIEEARRDSVRVPFPGNPNPRNKAQAATVDGGVERVCNTLPENGVSIPGTVSYEAFDIDMATVPLFWDFNTPHYREEQSATLEAIVEVEGPIHIELAARRLAMAWGLERLGPKVMRTVREAVSLCEKRKTVKVVNSFLWPAAEKNIVVRVPVPEKPETFRKIDYIPSGEIQQAVLLVLHHAGGIDADSLITETGRLFGYARMGPIIRKRFTDEISNMEAAGTIVRNGESVTLGKRGCADGRA